MLDVRDPGGDMATRARVMVLFLLSSAVGGAAACGDDTSIATTADAGGDATVAPKDSGTLVSDGGSRADAGLDAAIVTDAGAPDAADAADAAGDAGPPCFVPYGCTTYRCADNDSGIFDTTVSGTANAVGPRGSMDGGGSGANEAFLFVSGDTLSAKSGAMLQGNVSRTLALWAKPTATGAPQTLFNWGTFAATKRFGLLAAPTDTDYFVGEGDDVQGTVALTDGAWHHVAVTYDAVLGKITLYVDGNPDTTQTLAQALNTFGTNFAIGTTVGVAGREPFVGSISDVREYNRPLTGAEVASLATLTGVGANPESLRTFGTGLFFWLPLFGSKDITPDRCGP